MNAVWPIVSMCIVLVWTWYVTYLICGVACIKDLCRVVLSLWMVFLIVFFAVVGWRK